MNNVVFIDETNTKDKWHRIERMRAAQRKAHAERLNRRNHVQYVQGEKPLIIKASDRRVVDLVLLFGGLVLAALLMAL